MITIRQIERLFAAQQWGRLQRELMGNRPEASSAFDAALARVVPVAAMGLIRMDELGQGHHPLYRRLLNVVLTSQETDGGWSDPLTTALCLRALLAGNGQGGAIHGGLTYLAALQKTEGIWPKEPIRRMPEDAMVSAFVLFELGEFAAFRSGVRFADAIAWFVSRAKELDAEAARLWMHARTRCRVPTTYRVMPTLFSPRSAA